MAYPHLKLKDWPFRVVPDESVYRLMADRTQLANDIAGLMRNFSRRSASSLHLMWAWYGAGKTHTLRHIEHLCRNQFNSVIPYYTEFPKTAKSFIDLYRLFISCINLDLLTKSYMEVYTNRGTWQFQKELNLDFPDLVKALKLLLGGTEEEQALSIRWLRGESSDTRLLRRIGIGETLQTAERATKVITWLVRLLFLTPPLSGQTSLRTLWMVDEYQRIGKCREPIQSEINSCIHSLFNACPNGLTIIISFSGRPLERKLPAWISPEIKDRIGIEKPLLLPPMSTDEAKQFVRDILFYFRDASSGHVDPFFPFTEDCVSHTVQIIKKKAEIKPRALMQFFNAVLEEAEQQIEEGTLRHIDQHFADKILKNRTFMDAEE